MQPTKHKNLDIPDSKVDGANIGPIWGRQDPGGRHVGPVNFAIWGVFLQTLLPSLSCKYTHDHFCTRTY